MSYLVDTSVWIEYLSGRDNRLMPLLENNEVVIHPWIVGEIALGSLGRDRAAILGLLNALQHTHVASDSECMSLIERHNLGGCGVGWVDVQLLASTLLSSGICLMTQDRKLAALQSKQALKGHIISWNRA
jgi:predicted nucleic acid-binding protein